MTIEALIGILEATYEPLKQKFFKRKLPMEWEVIQQAIGFSSVRSMESIVSLTDPMPWFEKFVEKTIRIGRLFNRRAKLGIKPAIEPPTDPRASIEEWEEYRQKVQERKGRLARALEVCAPIVMARYRFKLSHASRRFDETDLFQNVAERAIHGYDIFRGDTDEAVQRWIFSIARREFKKLCREPKQEINVETIEEVSDDETPDTKAELGESTDAMYAALDRIPAKQASAVRMRYLEGAEYEVISETLDVSNSVARLLVSRGIKALRAKLKVAHV